MSKKFKSQASSSRAATGGSGAFSSSLGGFSTGSFSPVDDLASSSLTYIAEPPDLSRISEPRVVVVFKNLLKKDDITKAKALEDLKDYVSNHIDSKEGVQDGLLEAWVKVYPRTSIENARRVRQLAHVVQGILASLVGKRIARHLPKIIGAWLAGLYDNDRVVSRSVEESLTNVFPSEEKRNNVWKVYKTSILEFVEDVVLHQTPLTLSDERTVKPDDAEAKYARVVATAIHLFDQVLRNLPLLEPEKDLPLVESLLTGKSLWSLSYLEDPFVRRATYDLLQSSTSKRPEMLDWKILSTAIIGKALSSPQIGSASELSDALLQLTRIRPQIWTEDYLGKTPASKQLRQYIKRGSQGARDSYWLNLLQLLHAVPLEAIAKKSRQSDSDAKLGLLEGLSLLEAFQDGLNSRDEPRQNLEIGWRSYIDTGTWVSTLLAEEDKQTFIQGRIIPIVEQYVRGIKENIRWDLPSQPSAAICAICFITLVEHGYEDILLSSWVGINHDLLQAIKLSASEKSADFMQSQDSLCGEANRLFTLESGVLSRVSQSVSEFKISKIFEEASVPLIENSLQLLCAYNGKPYGAAAVLEEAVLHVPSLVRCSKNLIPLLEGNVPNLLFSHSAGKLITVFLECRCWDGFDIIFQTAVEQIVEVDPNEANIPALQKFLSMIDFLSTPECLKLEIMVMKMLERAIKGDKQMWPMVISAIENKTVRDEFLNHMFLLILDALSSETTVFDALFGLSRISSKGPATIQQFQKGPNGLKLLSRLLYLAESPDDEVAQLAESLRKKINDGGSIGMSTNLKILRSNLCEVGKESPSVDTLVSIAGELLRTTHPDERSQVASNVLPDEQAWKVSLDVFLNLPPRLATAIMSPLGGIVYLVDRELPSPSDEKRAMVARDSAGASSAFRMAAFVTKLFSSLNMIPLLGSKEQATLFYYLPLAIQLIDDDLKIEGCNGITGVETSKDREDYIEVVSEGWAIINSWIHSGITVKSGGCNLVGEMLFLLWKRNVDSLNDYSPQSYRIAETFVKISFAFDSLDTNKVMDSMKSIAKDAQSINAFRMAAWLAVQGHMMLSSTPAGTRLCNQLAADVTGFNSEKISREGLQILCLLNVVLQADGTILASVPTQRLIFLVKHLIHCLQSKFVSIEVQAETLKVLAVALRPINQIYGSHWKETTDILISIWGKTDGDDEALSVLHSSFRVFSCLKSLACGESNDDLEDAWRESKPELIEGLILSLGRLGSPRTFHQPRDITSDLLCRQITNTPIESIKGLNDIYPLLATGSRSVQRTAYGVLHQFVPKAQEQVSFDVALSKTAVKLPDELLCLLLDAPTMDSANEDKMWIGLRSYLLSWKIAFDHFSQASPAVQAGYMSSIKDHEALNPLLDFSFEFLEVPNGKLIDASKFDIRSFDLDRAESAAKEIQLLLVHLYYLSLRHLPNLTKSWWIDSKKRIKGSVEWWTEKFISPLIIEDSLANVSEWITTQDSSREYALSVKISPRASELVASICVEEETMPVAVTISLPSAYPLQPALVTGRSRVLVDEKTWRNWLSTIQGLIMFSNGSIIDGLLTFRRYIHSTLKDQSECAICYSVISTDMQTPNKRCATCKNTFHPVCLFRWFKSSNQSTCPLCRNNFIYV